MNILLRSPNILGICLLIAFTLPVTAHGQTSTGNKNCPDGIYRGKVVFTFIRKDLGPITSIVDNMLFFYGGEPKDLPQDPSSLRLKNVMLCSESDMAINTATKHLGTYTFLNKKCDISLNGTGQIRDKELIEQGNARLTCQDKSAYQGNYSITATNLLDAGGNQSTGTDQQKTGAKNNSSSSSGNSWNGLLLQPIEKNKEPRQGLKR